MLSTFDPTDESTIENSNELSDTRTKINDNKNQLRTRNLCAALINARSLAPKLESLAENFSERDWTFAIITETWLVKGRILDGVIDELKH